MSSQLLNQLGAFLPLFSHPVRTSPADRPGATRCTCTGSALSSAALLLMGCDQTWAGWKPLLVRSGIHFSFCWLQNVHRPLKQAGFLSFPKLFCVCAQSLTEEENWSLLAGMPGMDAVEMWPEEQPTITHLSFLSLCTCSMFFSILTAFRLLWTQLHPARWPCSQLESCAGRGTGWGADQMLRWSKIKKNPVGLSLIVLAGNVCV